MIAAAGLGAEWELARFAASTAARRERERDRAAALAAGADWSRIERLLRSARLLPTLGPRLLELEPPREFGAALDRALAEQRHQDALLVLLGDRVLAALAAAGLRAASLKGPALGEAIYGEPGRRQSSDIDLLLPAEELPAAVRVAEGMGYAPPEDPLDADGLALLHLSMVHERGQLPPLELHWRIHWYESRFARERLLPPRPAAPGWRPDPADELASLLLYYARDGFAGLRQAADLAAWWDRFGATVRPADVERTSRAYPELATALRVAALVGERIVGSPAGAGRPGAALSVRGRIAVGLGSRPSAYGSREQLFAEIALVDGLLTPRRGLRDFWRRQVAQPREVIRDHAEKAGARRRSSRLGHALRTLTRFALCLGRLARPAASSA